MTGVPMKVSKDFILRQVMDDYMLIPMGEAALQISAILTTNEVGAFLWECLTQDMDHSELVRRLMDEFDVDQVTATTDINEFLNELRSNKLLMD